MLRFTIVLVIVVSATPTNVWALQDSAESKPDDATQTRVRELIYVLRQHRVFERTDEWGSAIRELATIGPEACPELLHELKNTERSTTLRGLLFALRAIDDSRATPFIIDAIPKAERLSAGSDCGVQFANAELQRWMNQHEDFPDDDDSVSYGRPVNEIYATLHKLTELPLPDLTKAPYPTWNEEFWREWWKREAGLAKWANPRPLQLLTRNEDLVERAGVQRFGVLFPTGEGRRVGPVKNVTLESTVYADSRSHIDLDKAVLFETREGLRMGPEESMDVRQWLTWQMRYGIDLSAQSEIDVHLWLIHNNRWNTIDAEVQSDKPIDLGREAATLTPFNNHPLDFMPDQIGTFLFTTREGGRGIMRVYPREKGRDDRQIEYRLWDGGKADDVERPPAKAPDQQLVWETPRTVILKEPGFDKHCLFDLNQAKSSVLSRSIFSAESMPKDEDLLQFGLLRNERLAAWARENGVDMATHQFKANPAHRGKDAGSEKPVTAVTILDAREFRVTPEAFDGLTVSRAREIAARYPANFDLTWMFTTSESPDSESTYLFETKSGLLGLLQLSKSGETRTSIAFRYKLFRPAAK